MSDIHGRLTAFEKTLTKWNSDTEVLVLLGDYVDRGLIATVC
jgi:predicted phosphodiesterase